MSGSNRIIKKSGNYIIKLLSVVFLISTTISVLTHLVFLLIWEDDFNLVRLVSSFVGPFLIIVFSIYLKQFFSIKKVAKELGAKTTIVGTDFDIILENIISQESILHIKKDYPSLRISVTKNKDGTLTVSIKQKTFFKVTDNGLAFSVAHKILNAY